MLFLRNKNQNKWVRVIWSIIGTMVIISMVILYMPIF